MSLYNAYTVSARTQIKKKGTEVKFRTVDPEGVEKEVVSHAVVLPPSSGSELGLSDVVSQGIYQTRAILMVCVPEGGEKLTYAIEALINNELYRVSHKETLAPDGATDILYYIWCS